MLDPSPSSGFLTPHRRTRALCSLCPQHGLSPGPQAASGLPLTHHRGAEAGHHQRRRLHPPGQTLQLSPEGTVEKAGRGVPPNLVVISVPQDYRRRQGYQLAQKPHPTVPWVLSSLGRGPHWPGPLSYHFRSLFHCCSALALCQACAAPQGKQKMRDSYHPCPDGARSLGEVSLGR